MIKLQEHPVVDMVLATYFVAIVLEVAVHGGIIVIKGNEFIMKKKKRKISSVIYRNLNFRSVKEEKDIILNIFQRFDLHNDGFINVKEALLHYNVTSDKQWFYELDLDFDGKISPIEFDNDLA